MKAVVCSKYGAPDVLQIKEVEKPIPGNNEVLIKVHAATVNRTDCATLRGKPSFARIFTGLFKPNKSILGTEFAGKIEAVGKEVTNFKVGNRVFGLDDGGLSSHAQYMVLSANNTLTTIPDNIDYEQAAVSFEGAHYAYNFINKIDLKSGQKVLVIGATGGIGSASVQLLKYFGANVTAVCEGKNSDLVKALGAEGVIDYTNDDFTKSSEKYNYVFDTVGKSSFAKCKPLLKSGGVYISSELGSGSQNVFLALITPLFGGKKVVFPMPKDRNGSVLLIKKLIEQEKFKAVIDRRYSLEEIPEAFSYVEKGQKIGNVVIKIDKS